jgi:hypothetical protein
MKEEVQSRASLVRSIWPSMPRDGRAGSRAETFLIAAVATIVLVRGYLRLTGYPQVGGGGLHVAHLLWGGLLMLAGLMLMLFFLGEAPKRTAAWLSGVGFGLFIDELGKFITEDNDYFYRPAIALIYVVFIGLFLAMRAMQGRRPLSPAEHLHNALALLDRSVSTGLDLRTRHELLGHLAAADQAQPLVATLRQAVLATPLVEPGRSTLIDAPRRFADFLYRRLTGWRGFAGAVAGLFVLQAIGLVASAVGLVLADPGSLVANVEGLSFVEAGSLASSLVSGVFVVLGALWLPRSRLTAFRWFDRALLVSLFVAQFFAFAQSQLGALTGMVVTLLLLGAVRYVMKADANRALAAG